MKHVEIAVSIMRRFHVFQPAGLPVRRTGFQSRAPAERALGLGLVAAIDCRSVVSRRGAEVIAPFR